MDRLGTYFLVQLMGGGLRKLTRLANASYKLCIIGSGLDT